MSRNPDFIIIGAMKCATTSLHDQLALQPGMVLSTPKEPNFFSDRENWARGMAWYRGLFADAKPGDLCGESSTHYTKLPRHPKVVKRLAEHVPGAKFIYVMRHPIDRLVSHYIHEWTMKVLTEPIDASVDQHRALIDFSRYAWQLEPYFEQFGRDRVLPVFFDRLRTHPQEELERVCKFIGYDQSPTWQKQQGPSNVSGQRMRNSWLRDLVVEAPVLSTIRRRLVPQQVRDKIKSMWTMRERPQLSDSRRAQLVETFDPDLARLGEWLGIELSCSNFVAQTREQAHEWAPQG